MHTPKKNLIKENHTHANWYVFAILLSYKAIEQGILVEKLKNHQFFLRI